MYGRIDVILHWLLFLYFQEFERMNVADALESKAYQDGDVIINQVWAKRKNSFLLNILSSIPEWILFTKLLIKMFTFKF